MIFKKLRTIIHDELVNSSFESVTSIIEQFIFSLSIKDLISIVIEIGTIPEEIPHDSSEEKLYAKTTDIVLAKSLQELGLTALVVKSRANCADVLAKSSFHSYSLVGDAKAFRLSRTAKNQKDFKVHSMALWKGDNDYSILVCPFFHYPRSFSQIYTQALLSNVLLFSWEHIAFLLSKNIKEDQIVSFEKIWNSSNIIAKDFSIADKKVIFWDKQNDILCKHFNLDPNELDKSFLKFKNGIVKRGKEEIIYYEDQINKINGYSREEAISELIKSKKLNEKVSSIRSFISYLEGK